ncbi:MAG: PIN domain-containing protein [Burkholderiaceae bacterium]|nr:PIN domain-containing protein [Burkholderiaceae bacterium]
MRALLDVNVLIALLDQGHVHHAAARAWLSEHIALGWASCPITQNGCIRIMSQPGYPAPLAPAQVADRLRMATGTAHHAFWPDDLDLVGSDDLRWTAILGSRQITDAYLLALAVRNGGRFVTFDRAAPLAAVAGAAAAHLVVL